MNEVSLQDQKPPENQQIPPPPLPPPPLPPQPEVQYPSPYVLQPQPPANHQYHFQPHIEMRKGGYVDQTYTGIYQQPTGYLPWMGQRTQPVAIAQVSPIQHHISVCYQFCNFISFNDKANTFLHPGLAEIFAPDGVTGGDIIS